MSTDSDSKSSTHLIVGILKQHGLTLIEMQKTLLALHQLQLHDKGLVPTSLIVLRGLPLC